MDNLKQMGGNVNTGYDTTGAWAGAVFGNPQTATPGAGNAIFMNQVKTCGGKHKKHSKSKKHGKSKKHNKSRKHRKSRKHNKSRK